MSISELHNFVCNTRKCEQTFGLSVVAVDTVLLQYDMNCLLFVYFAILLRNYETET